MGRQCAARSYMICEARNDSAPHHNYGVERERGVGGGMAIYEKPKEN